jgi:hypothetical protein
MSSPESLAALTWYAAGCTPIPIRLDGSKAPYGEWRQWINQRPEFPPLISDDAGIAIICGATSGNLEMLEFEGLAVREGLWDALQAALPNVPGLQAVVDGYGEESPKNGLHLFYRVSDAPALGNTKLASRPARPNEWTAAERDNAAKGLTPKRTLIETRGQGGYVIVAPTRAEASDPAGPYGQRPWVQRWGSPATIATITAEQRREIHVWCRSLHIAAPVRQMAPMANTSPVGAAITGANDGDRPGDVFARQHTWAQILTPHGWRELYQHGGKTYWCRPGKESGVSATTTDDGPGDPGGLWVFTTSSTFEPEQQYTKFAAYAHLEHGGSMATAAGKLAGNEPSPMMALLKPYAAPAQPLGAGTGAPGVADDAPPPSTWLPVDLGPILDGTHQPVQPAHLPRRDGVNLLYPGLVHSFHGESESGKSLLAQIVCATVLLSGKSALYVDFESDASTVAGRLLLMGVPGDTIKRLFSYIRPDARPGGLDERPAYEMMMANPFTVAIIDGVTEGMGMFGVESSKDNDQVALWIRAFPRRLAQNTGAAVVLIDHVTKNQDTRGRFAIGAQAKMAGLDGAGYTVEVAEQLGRGSRGAIRMRIGKDRPGYIRAKCGAFRASDRTQEAAYVIVDSRDETHIQFEVCEPQPLADRNAVLMQRVSEWMSQRGGRAVSQTEIREAMKARTEDLGAALGSLESAGCLIIRREGRSNMHTHVRTWTHAPADSEGDDE